MSTSQIDPFSSAGFNLSLSQLSQSETYAKFCDEVYGRNLSQFNAFSDDQLQFLITHLRKINPERILDLGCGIGRIAEYLAQITESKVTGVDFANEVIAAAKARVSSNSNLDFTTGDLNLLPAHLGQYDVILAIDTLCFVEDLQSMIHNLRRHLAPGGRIIAFHSYRNKNLDASDPLPPEQSSVGDALTKAGFGFRTFDFSDSEKALWQRAISAAEKLKNGFESEGYQSICESRIWEANRNLDWFAQGKYRRTMFISTIQEADTNLK